MLTTFVHIFLSHHCEFPLSPMTSPSMSHLAPPLSLFMSTTTIVITTRTINITTMVMVTHHHRRFLPIISTRTSRSTSISIKYTASTVSPKQTLPFCLSCWASHGGLVLEAIGVPGRDRTRLSDGSFSGVAVSVAPACSSTRWPCRTCGKDLTNKQPLKSHIVYKHPVLAEADAYTLACARGRRRRAFESSYSSRGLVASGLAQRRIMPMSGYCEKNTQFASIVGITVIT